MILFMKNKHLQLVLLFFCLYGISLNAQKWTPQAAGLLPAGYAIYGLSVVDENTAWAVADVDTVTYAPPIPSDHLIKVLKTTDGGQSWSVYDVEESMGRLSWDVQGLDGNTAWLTTQDYGSGLGRVLFKTEDGGETWEQKLFHRAGGVFVRLLSEQHIYCQNNRFVAWSEDGGNNWVYDTLAAYAPDEFNVLTSGSNMAAAVGDTVWVGTNKGRVCRATNYGQHIELFDTGQGTDAEIYCIAFTDHLNGLLQTWKPDGSVQLLRTADGGATWQLTTAQPPANGETYNISAVPGLRGVFLLVNDGYSSFMSNTVNSFYTTDFGESLIPMPSFAGTSNCIQLSSLRAGWATTALVADATTPTFYQWDGSDLYGRLFVNASATGAKTGLNWANAFTDLQDALTAASEGSEIWVAAGTYTPAGPGGSADATFLLEKNIQLLGGFAGNETDAAARDPEANPTILSGDLNGDDVVDDFAVNRGDNVTTVVMVTFGVTNAALIDGFTISGGQADGTGDNESPARSGGGLYSNGHPTVQHCVFHQNYAVHRGGGAYFDNVSGLVIENNRFEKNKAGSLGGGLHVDSGASSALEIKQCTFVDNDALRGAGLNIQNAIAKVEDCTFLSNFTTQHGGGLRYSGAIYGQSIEVIDSYFEGNQSSFGGGLRLETLADNNSFLVSGCQFVGNSVSPLEPGWGQAGGAVSLTIWPEKMNNSAVFENCQFMQNSSTSYVGGLQLLAGGKNSNLEFHNLQFLENASEVETGAMDLYFDYGGSGTVLVDSCHFEHNISGNFGALSCYAGYEDPVDVDYTVSKSIFLSNEASEGGALGLWSEQSSSGNLVIENCIINGNIASQKGGGFLLLNHSPNYHTTFERSHIFNNQSQDGGAIKAYLLMENTPFPDGATCTIENSLITGNSSNNSAISMELFPHLILRNSTIADNQGGSVELANQSGLTLQNSILYNPGYLEFIDLTEDASITSYGGNLLSDNSLDAWLNNTDQPAADPLLDGNFQLTQNSPAVDAGLAYEEMPELDLAGNSRLQGSCIDIGAYESVFDTGNDCKVVTSTHEALAEQPLGLFPNPASSFLKVDLPVASSQPFHLQVLDAQGKVLSRQMISSGDMLAVEALPAGMYWIKTVVDGIVYTGKFVKR